MDNMRKKERLVNIIMATILSAFMGAVACFVMRSGMSDEQLSSSPAFVMYLSSIFESIIIGVFLVIVIPFGKWGRMLAGKFGANPPGMKFTCLNSIPVSVGSAILVSCSVSFINVFFAHSKIPSDVAPPLLVMWFPNWLRLLIPSIVISYVLSIIISPFIVRAAGLGGPPKSTRPMQ